METKTLEQFEKLARFIRYYSIAATTQAGSGHATSSMSATDLMTVLWFGGYFTFDFDNPDNPANDRLIFSKGHASPLYYALFLAAGVITADEMMTLRRFDSRLEGHPTPRFPFTEAATGSLGQGLSVGVGQALALRAKSQKSGGASQATENRQPNIYVLLGDGEMAEGSVWEAINLASKYRLDNISAIVDVNRLGQSEETMLGWDTDAYRKRFEAFGWRTTVIDGHDYEQIASAFNQTQKEKQKPYAIIAKTIKGKGVSEVENKDGWHGKPLPKDIADAAQKEIGPVDHAIRGTVRKPERTTIQARMSTPSPAPQMPNPPYRKTEEVATRQAYGETLARVAETEPRIVVLDAEVKNSTYAEIFKKTHPDRFFEMYIAEQNMVGVGIGMAKRGYMPFVSTFSAFFTRAFDQIRMAALTQSNIKFCGSHAGVSIGEDGPSQMGLEDIAMFRAVHDSVVLYPADAIATEKCVREMVRHTGISYLRTARPATPVLYRQDEEFPIGGCKVHDPKSRGITGIHGNPVQKILIIAAGITLYEALNAQKQLAKEGILATVVDCYSIKPIDKKTLTQLAADLSGKPTFLGAVTVEDHWSEGGLGDAVLGVYAENPHVPVRKLAVTKMPRSGKPRELMDYEGISDREIIKTVRSYKR